MLSVSSFSSPSSPSSPHCLFTSISPSSSFLSFSQNPNLSRSISCLASSSSSSSSKYQNPQNKHGKPSKKRLVEKRHPLKKQSLSKRNNFDDTNNGFNGDNNDFDDGDEGESFHPSPLPQPPAGFVLDSHGKVLMASSKRLATIVDNTNNLPLECVIRRVFESSKGDQCMLLCPVDTPVQILKSSNFDGWSAVNDEEVEAIIPAAAFALAKIHMHLVISGFCYTARGGFCYSEEDILEFRTDDGEEIDGLPTEGVEITCFNLDGGHYMIYTPSDPLLFVAVKDKDGYLRIADDELLEDAAVVGAIDEETEFNALVEEEAALLESLLGER